MENAGLIENAMTREQVDAKFSNVPLRFVRYWKYLFTFAGKSDDGHVITAATGGNHDDIYRLEVDVSKPLTLGSCSEWNYVTISHGDQKVFEYAAD